MGWCMFLSWKCVPCAHFQHKYRHQLRHWDVFIQAESAVIPHMCSNWCRRCFTMCFYILCYYYYCTIYEVCSLHEDVFTGNARENSEKISTIFFSKFCLFLQTFFWEKENFEKTFPTIFQCCLGIYFVCYLPCSHSVFAVIFNINVIDFG